jgi:hypothetical protein
MGHVKITIRVLVYRVGQAPVVEEISDSLDALQAIVGGYIEPVPLAPNILLICNERGKLDGLPFNRTVCVRGPPFNRATCGVEGIVGDFFVVRTEGPEFVSLRATDIVWAKEFIGTDDPLSHSFQVGLLDGATAAAEALVERAGGHGLNLSAAVVAEILDELARADGAQKLTERLTSVEARARYLGCSATGLLRAMALYARGWSTAVRCFCAAVEP